MEVACTTLPAAMQDHRLASPLVAGRKRDRLVDGGEKQLHCLLPTEAGKSPPWHGIGHCGGKTPACGCSPGHASLGSRLVPSSYFSSVATNSWRNELGATTAKESMAAQPSEGAMPHGQSDNLTSSPVEQHGGDYEQVTPGYEFLA